MGPISSISLDYTVLRGTLSVENLLGSDPKKDNNKKDKKGSNDCWSIRGVV
jgi:hypothetical protein